ncbi:MAG: ABC transporter ATP-binding protein, partial [Bacteroidetes bacterium]
MNYLTLENVGKSFGDKVLFRDLNLQINKGEKVALVARNGAGKSTLLKVVAGLEAPEGENARLLLHRDIRLGYLPQEPLLDERQTVLEVAFSADNPLLQALRDYEQALLLPDQRERLQNAMARLDDLQAWDFEARVKEILFKLDITQLDQPVGELSGGQRKRLALARLLIEEPDFLVLDEPTNHLDMDMIEWLENYLQAPNRTLLMVTHDRYFLERVCDTILELDRGTLFRYPGNYSEFLERKASRHEVESAELEKTRKLLRRELEWIRRMPKARGTKAKARVDKFHQLQEKAATKLDRAEVRIDFEGSRLGGKILECHNLSKSFGELKIVEGFDYKFKKGERVGIVGPNGVGKTTFLRLLTGELRPDGGKVVIGGTVRFGYYTQQGIQLDEDKRVIDVVRAIAEYIPLEKGRKLTAEQLLERFLFDRRQQQVYVSQLSGGEKRRLHLLTVLMQNPNFLLLDEPTNDLDILTLNVLEDWLLRFPGCVVIVTHDRFFLDKIAHHLFVFTGDGHIKDFNGTYQDYRRYVKELEREARRSERLESEKRKSHEPAPKPGLSPEQRRELKRLERQIQKLEERRTEILERFAAGTTDAAEIARLSAELKELESQI